MAFDFEEFRDTAGQVRGEHETAIQDCETAGKDVADGEAKYRAARTTAVENAKVIHGATVAEAIADGQPDVVQAFKVLAIRKAKDRAAVQRVYLAEADQKVLLTLGSWSKSQEQNER